MYEYNDHPFSLVMLQVTPLLRADISVCSFLDYTPQDDKRSCAANGMTSSCRWRHGCGQPSALQLRIHRAVNMHLSHHLISISPRSQEALTVLLQRQKAEESIIYYRCRCRTDRILCQHNPRWIQSFCSSVCLSQPSWKKALGLVSWPYKVLKTERDFYL